MIRAILFDLDNTLLTNSMDRFLPAYLELISAHAADHVEPATLIRDLLAATAVMAKNADPAVSNKEAFWGEFSRLTGLDPTEMIPFFTRFYRTRFNDIRLLTEHRPDARPLMEWAFRQGYAVVIATNPLFPLVAVEQRLAWAGIGVEDFDYDWITTYENSHYSKPHLGYYREILAQVDCAPAQTLMVGDDWERDIVPARQLGMGAYWICSPEARSPGPDVDIPAAARGTLADFWASCQSGWLDKT